MTTGRPQIDRESLCAVDDRPTGRLVAEQHEVERLLGLEISDRPGECPTRALRIPVVVLHEQYRSLHSDAHRIAQLLLGLRRAEREHRRLTTELLDELCGHLDRALLVRARRERQVGVVDPLSVVGDVDASARRGHAFDTDEDLHRARHSGSVFIRSSVGSNSGRLPTLATRTGNCSFM